MVVSDIRGNPEMSFDVDESIINKSDCEYYPDESIMSDSSPEAIVKNTVIKK